MSSPLNKDVTRLLDDFQGCLVDYLRSRGRTVLGGDALLHFALYVSDHLCCISY